MEIRIQKWLADAGIASRRAAEKLIADGRVSVNGKTAAVGDKAETERDSVTLDGKPVSYGTELVYLMLHKPEGVVTTMHDPEGRASVKDFLTELDARVYPVGRLDYDSSGLLLFTNDGGWANGIVHPRFGVSKKYAAWVIGVPSREKLTAFEGGLLIDGRKTTRAGIKITKTAGEKCLLHITLTEGRNRQVRKMCEAIGHSVISLKRIAVGPIKLGDLPKGKWRMLTDGEVKGLL